MSAPVVPAPIQPAHGLHNIVVEVPGRKGALVRESEGFEKKELSQFKLDLLEICNFSCSYCSTNRSTWMRVNEAKFAALAEEQTGKPRTAGEDPGLTLVWPNVLEKLAAELATKPPTWGAGKTLVFSMQTDGFGPRLIGDGTTEAALRLVLERTSFRVRVLTKNAAVGTPEWIAFFKAFPGRFVVGLSTGSLDDRWAGRIEVGTSRPSMRLAATRALQDAGVPTFGMACPVFPDVLDGDGVERLVESIRPGLVETFWAEPFNDRDNWEKVRKGYPEGSPGHEFLTEVYERKNKARWSAYATDLYLRLRAHAERHGWLPKLRYLLYEDLITAADADRLGDMAGILLQSKPGEDGLSQNPHIAARQLALGA